MTGPPHIGAELFGRIAGLPQRVATKANPPKGGDAKLWGYHTHRRVTLAMPPTHEENARCPARIFAPYFWWRAR